MFKFVVNKLFLRRVSATIVGHIQGARRFIDVHSLCGNLCGREEFFYIGV